MVPTRNIHIDSTFYVFCCFLNGICTCGKRFGKKKEQKEILIKLFKYGPKVGKSGKTYVDKRTCSVCIRCTIEIRFVIYLAKKRLSFSTLEEMFFNSVFKFNIRTGIHSFIKCTFILFPLFSVFFCVVRCICSHFMFLFELSNHVQWSESKKNQSVCWIVWACAYCTDCSFKTNYLWFSWELVPIFSLKYVQRGLKCEINAGKSRKDPFTLYVVYLYKAQIRSQ